MLVCTFFGHKDAPDRLEELLRSAIADLIINKDVKKFYVGNQGNFDNLVYKVLKSINLSYPQIDYNIVLAYMPDGNTFYNNRDIYPAEIEKVPKRFAISWRNKWMIKHSDFVITYVTHSWGGAAKFKELAEKQGKSVINLNI